MNLFQLSEDTSNDIETRFNEMAYKEFIERKLLEFLKQNLSHLPMYAHPAIVRDILRDFQSSPMFT